MVNTKARTLLSDLATKLPVLDPVYGRNFRIHDTCLESAPESALGKPGAEAGDNTLSSIPADILEELSPEELISFQDARAREADWRSKWRTERFDGLRAYIPASVEWFPK